MTDPSNDIRVSVQLEPDMMRRLGTLAKAKGVSVRELITSILSDVADTVEEHAAAPSFLDDEKPTRVIRKNQRPGHTADDG